MAYSEPSLGGDAEPKGYVPETDVHQPGGDVEAPGQRALARKLKNRHMQMIAIGGSIGAGLFVGSGSALSAGGPASLVIGFIIVGVMMLLTVNALGELAVMYPVNGSFYAYSVRFVDPAWGFAMGWNYVMSWLVILPFELTAAGITISFWTERADGTLSVNVGVWITIFLVLVTIVNIFGVRGYGEVEFVLGLIKVIACIGFIIFAIVVDCGGTPTPDRPGYIGARYWYDPGAFNNGFQGFCSVFVTASFSFGGTELVGLAAAEADHPRRTIPKATKQVFWRITIFYVLCLFLVGLIVPSNNPNLSSATGANTKYSPFVTAIVLAGVKGLPSVFNAVITLSVISVANSSTYGSTRTIQALALNNMAPAIFRKVDRHGRPYAALMVALAFGLLAYINIAPTGKQIFNWLLALSGLSNFFTWGSICLSHIRFRHAWKHAGRNSDDLPFAAMFGVIGSWVGLGLNVLCLIATFYISLFPVGGPNLNPEAFFESYLAAPIVILFFIGYKVYQATRSDLSWGVDLKGMDLDAGRRDLDFKAEIEAERAAARELPLWRKIYNFWF